MFFIASLHFLKDPWVIDYFLLFFSFNSRSWKDKTRRQRDNYHVGSHGKIPCVSPSWLSTEQLWALDNPSTSQWQQVILTGMCKISFAFDPTNLQQKTSCAYMDDTNKHKDWFWPNHAHDEARDKEECTASICIEREEFNVGWVVFHFILVPL